MNIPKNAGLLDKIIYPKVNIFVPYFFKYGFTPNMVTTITLVIRLIVIYNLYYKRNYTLIILLFIISWFTDCVDGQLARNYNMKSEFGGIYDVVVDIVSSFFIFVILYFIYYKKMKSPIIIFFVIMCFIILLGIIKTKCFIKEDVKVLEKKISNIKIDTSNCIFFRFVKIYDESCNYLVIVIFMVYTLFFY